MISMYIFILLIHVDVPAKGTQSSFVDFKTHINGDRLCLVSCESLLIQEWWNTGLFMFSAVEYPLYEYATVY